MSRRELIGTAVAIAASATVLAGCGSSGSGLIPPANANALEHDFSEIQRAASQGECTGAREMIERAEADFAALPNSVAKPLRERLGEGISNLRTVALQQCSTTATTTTATPTTTSTTTESPTATTTSRSRTTTTTSSETSSTETEAVTTSHTQTEPTPAPPPPPGGGTPPGEREQEAGGTPPKERVRK